MELEMLMTYDKNLNPVGEKTREAVHTNGLLHKTVRVWLVQGDKVWFQRRARSKKLFPGKLDPIATGHINAGEEPAEAAARELQEETSLDVRSKDLIPAGDIPFPFERPDGKLDNEHACVYVYIVSDTPVLKFSSEVTGYVRMLIDDYKEIVRGDVTVMGEECTGTQMDFGHYSVQDFCCPNEMELNLVLDIVNKT